MWGEEYHLIEMKRAGSTGDFIVYEKADDAQCPLRVAFLKEDENAGNQMRAQKIKVVRTQNGNRGGKGFGLQSSYVRWYDSIPKMIHYIKNDTNHILTKPYFYKTSVSHHSPLPPKRPPPPPRQKPADVQTNDSSSDPSDDESQEEEPPISEHGAAAAGGEQLHSDDDIEIVENRKNVRSLIEGKPVGTYVIHRGRKNKPQNPYTIYAIKYSKRENRDRVVPANIYYDPEEQSYRVGHTRKTFPSLSALINGNRAILKDHYIEPTYVTNPHHTLGDSKRNTKIGERKSSVIVIKENYKRYIYNLYYFNISY